MKKLGLSKRNGIITAIISLPIFMAGQGTLQAFSTATTSTHFTATICIALICSLILAIFQTIWTKKICIKALKESVLNIERKIQDRSAEQMTNDEEQPTTQYCSKNRSQIIELAFYNNKKNRDSPETPGYIRNDLGCKTYDQG